MKTAVVILNWNGEKFLRKFLPGLAASVRGKDAEVIVADNASTDGSMRLLEYEFPKIRTIRFSRNYGFTGGYNRALFQTESEYFVLINSDIEVTEGWLDPLVEWMDTHPECGICAPKLHSYHEKDRFEYAGAAGGYIDRFGYPFCRGRVLKKVEKDTGQYDNPVPVFWASGACLNAVKNDGYGICTIYGGTFTNEAEGGAAVMSAGTMTIYDGTFVQESDAAISNVVRNTGAGSPVAIEGGSFTGELYNEGADGFAISGGTFDRTFSMTYLTDAVSVWFKD